MKKVFFLLFGVLCLPARAHAYIDPGSGGYLVGSILPMIAGFVAMFFAFFIHFFRHTLWNFFKNFRNKRRWLLILLLALGVSGLGYFLVMKFVIERAYFDASLSGAHMYDAAAAEDGYNLFEGKLIDMQGKIVKEWKQLSLGVIDKNGDYYAQQSFEAPVWGRYAWNGRVIWEKNFPIHHEILFTPRDTIMTFTKEVHTYQGRPVEFDVILELDKDGNELQRFSFWDHLKEFQQYHKKLELDQPPTFMIPESHRKDKSIWGGNYDYYHLNSLSLISSNALEKVHPAFRPGNWLISFRHGSIVFILDQDTKEVLWRAIYDQVPDRLEGPHAPWLLPDGNILLFDNGRYRGWSRILELEPVTLKIAWEYRDKSFYTLSQGYVQELSNRNMLVTEAEKGRVFELTREKRIVWEYYHPDKQNKKNSTDKKKWGLRQEIYRMTRYPKAMIDQFLKDSAAS